MSTLYAQTSTAFIDGKVDDFLLFASTDPQDIEMFSERGYDAFSGVDKLAVLSVTPADGLTYADGNDVDLAAEEVGLSPFLSFEEYMEFWPNPKAEEFKEREFRGESKEPNNLLAHKAVRDALKSKGFDAFQGYVIIGIDTPDLRIFWDRKTFNHFVVAERAPEDNYFFDLEEAQLAGRHVVANGNLSSWSNDDDKWGYSISKSETDITITLTDCDGNIRRVKLETDGKLFGLQTYLDDVEEPQVAILASQDRAFVHRDNPGEDIVQLDDDGVTLTKDIDFDDEYSGPKM